MFAKYVLLSALVSSTFATVFITQPTASSTFAAGQNATIQWIDQNGSPTLQTFGSAVAYIATGNSKQQTMLQKISDNFDVSKVSTLQFAPDPKIGPNGNNYFIRIESQTQKDSSGYPVMSFSAQFTMSGMTGTFNSSIQAQINGQSTAPIGGSTTAGSSTTGSSGASTTGASTTGSASSASKTSATTAAVAAASTNGAMGSVVANVWISAVFGAVVLALML